MATRLGYKTTRDLLSGEDAPVKLYLNSRNRLPECAIFPRPYMDQAGAAEHCPFLRWEDTLIEKKHRELLLSGKLPGSGSFWLSAVESVVPVDGVPTRKTKFIPRFGCGLGPSAPTQCQLFPMGRAATAPIESSAPHWAVFCDVRTCQKCMPSTIRNGGTSELVGHWVTRPEVQSSHGYNQDMLNLMTMIVRSGIEDGAKMAIAAAIFDFDGILIDAKAWSPDRRPQTPNETMQAAAALLGMIRSGAQVPDGFVLAHSGVDVDGQQG